MKELGDLDITEITLTLQKEHLAKQSNRLKPVGFGLFVPLVYNR